MKIIRIAISLYILTVASLNASIVEIKSIDCVLKHVDKDSMVFFDIDNTICAADEARATDQWFSAMLAHAKTLGYQELPAVAAVLPYYEEAQKKSSVHAVESQVATIIRTLQQRHIPVMTLTARSLPFVHCTKRQLRSIGIDLSCALFKKTDCMFTLKNGKARFLNGCMFCGNNDKGEVLLQLLRAQQLAPKKIVFIDDKAKNLRCVQQALAKKNIAFVGLRYGKTDAEVKSFVLDDASKALLPVCKG